MIKQISLIITAAIFAACGYGCSKHHTMKKNLITDKNEFWDDYDKRTKYFFKMGNYSDSGLIVGGGGFAFLKDGKCVAYAGYSERKKNVLSFLLMM